MSKLGSGTSSSARRFELKGVKLTDILKKHKPGFNVMLPGSD
jgi:hypothetical protein